MPSFDVVSELEMFEVNHAVGNTTKEIATRFDFRGSNVKVELNEKTKEVKLTGESDFQVEQVFAIFENHMLKRKIDPQCMDPQKMTASGKEMHQIIKLKDGLDSDTAKKIAKAIKESGIKAQASIQGDKVRVTDKKKDTLQAVMNLLRGQSFGIPLQFNNFKD
jgi:hypothetical protein